jgi:hypothetical protein
MRKFILLTLGLLISTLVTFAQPIRSAYAFDSTFNVVKTYPIEMRYFYSDKALEGEDVISCEEGYYMEKVTNAPDFKVKFNKEGDKAMIDFWSFNRMVFMVEENDNRLTLYSKRPEYFGFVYDKRFKVLYNFNSRKHRRHINRHIRNYPMLLW